MREQPFQGLDAEELDGGHEIDLARDGGADHEGVGQRVGVVGREEHRPRRRHALGMKTLDAPEVEPQRQANEPAH